MILQKSPILGGANLPDTNDAIRVAREEGGAIGRPTERDARGRGLAGLLGEFWTQIVDDATGLEVPNLDATRRGGSKPVSSGRKGKRVDFVASIQLEEGRVFAEVPQHDTAVLAARGTKRAIGRHLAGVDVASMAEMLDGHRVTTHVPHLDHLVPAAGHHHGRGLVRREPSARDPFRVRVLDVYLAVALDVPNLDRLVTRARHNLTIVGR